MKTIFNSEKGFTLIEVLVVMILLLAVGTIIGVILFSSLQGSNKTNTVTKVRQNGNFAISQMVKTIRNARNFNGVSADGTAYITDCSQSPDTRYSHIKITLQDNTPVVFSCSNGQISSNGVSLIDTAAVSVAQDSCYFICSQGPGVLNPPTIKINFSLSQYQQPDSLLLPEKTATIPFETSVTLRNAPR